MNAIRQLNDERWIKSGLAVDILHIPRTLHNNVWHRKKQKMNAIKQINDKGNVDGSRYTTQPKSSPSQYNNG